MSIKLGDLTLYDISDLAEIFKMNKVSLRAYCKEGRIKAKKIGKKWYVSEGNLKEYFGEPNNNGNEKK